MKLKFWGTRGSIPVPGEKTLKYGGNTPCIEIRSGNNDLIILDAGTGIREFGKELIKSNPLEEMHLFISHSHWDHIQGLPFFGPFFREDFKANIYSFTNGYMHVDNILDAQMNPNFFPVGKEVFPANIKYNKINDQSKLQFGELELSTCKVHHSEGTLSFKAKENGKTFVYMTDNEIFYNADEDHEPNLKRIFDMNESLIEFCSGADYLIHDSMYSFNDFRTKIGWGHSNNIALAYFSKLANIKNLVLFHYDPDYCDSDIDALLESTTKKLRELDTNIDCIASSEGMQLEL
ncbi:MAG: MBL fold metallo-hydrolase [Melioribacteraceae bacterium]|nr:MBL fold metallo-hydrolase [Melioribacteraceae bacterium]MCF8352916.1 MBL fold metallo-hydrolase [Melioribacteraceae bacterium]MCF8395257.1 MBL fold metallo-hydrolase [Melioribacteraceae bacterium]MCF8417433.1 MBL fold metallo-hydrolase [Melioribacteraceae bacterium]